MWIIYHLLSFPTALQTCSFEVCVSGQSVVFRTSIGHASCHLNSVNGSKSSVTTAVGLNVISEQKTSHTSKSPLVMQASSTRNCRSSTFLFGTIMFIIVDFCSHFKFLLLCQLYCKGLLFIYFFHCRAWEIKNI